MTKIERNVTITVALIGMISGLSGVFVSWDSAKFKQPMDQHASNVASYKSQIESVEKRGDTEEVERLRIEYEIFEENYRQVQIKLAVVNSYINLAPSELPELQRNKIVTWLEDTQITPSLGSSYLPSDIGNALFLVGDYEKAASIYSTIVEKEPLNGYGLMSQARAFRYLALNSDDPEEVIKLDIKAFESAKAALNLIDNAQLPSATATDPVLAALMGEIEKLKSQ